MKIAIISIAVLSLLTSCGPSMKVTSAWTNKPFLDSAKTRGTYKTIFIAVISSKLELKVELESRLAAAAKAHGFIPIQSLEKIPQITGQKPPKELFLNIIKESGADAIFTTTIVDQKTETKYIQGRSVGIGIYPPYGYYGGGFSPYGVYGGFYNYYGAAWDMFSTPGYYTEDKTYYLESNLFDLKTEALVWSAHTKARNPSKLEKSTQQYTENMMAQLEEDGLLKKSK